MVMMLSVTGDVAPGNHPELSAVMSVDWIIKTRRGRWLELD